MIKFFVRKPKITLSSLLVIMSSGIASLHKVLKDETRRKIILLLQEKGSLTYVDLMKALEITNTGKMNYHLKVLGDLLSKKEDGQYALTEKGTIASRLLLEFPEVTTRQIGLIPKRTQVLWGGIIICSFAIIGLFILLRFLFFAEFTISQTHGLEYGVPLIFVCVVFLFIGSYMIISDVKKDAKTSHKLSGLTKRKAVVLVFLIMLGMVLIGLANSPMDYVSPLIPKYFFSATGVFTLIAGVLSFLGFKRDELFHGRKTGFFWWGLIIFGLVLSWLFGLLWMWFFLEHGFNGILFAFFGPSSGIIEISVILLLLYIGFYMMKKGAKKESEAYGLTSELKIFKLKFDLSERNYRGLVYLLASIIINAWLVAIGGNIYSVFLFYINIVGFWLIFLFGWLKPMFILSFALLVFGLFVEIFVVCEFVISITKLRKK